MRKISFHSDCKRETVSSKENQETFRRSEGKMPESLLLADCRLGFQRSDRESFSGVAEGV